MLAQQERSHDRRRVTARRAPAASPNSHCNDMCCALQPACLHSFPFSPVSSAPWGPAVGPGWRTLGMPCYFEGRVALLSAPHPPPTMRHSLRPTSNPHPFRAPFFGLRLLKANPCPLPRALHLPWRAALPVGCPCSHPLHAFRTHAPGPPPAAGPGPAPAWSPGSSLCFVGLLSMPLFLPSVCLVCMS